MRFGFDGILKQKISEGRNFDPETLANWNKLLSYARPRHVEFGLIQGFAGCGKSHPIIQALKKRNDYRVVVPSTHLRDSWKTDLSLKTETWRVSTWEMGLLRSSRFLIIDELYKIPPGYIDLIITLDPIITTVIALADPLQGEYYSTSPSSTLAQIIPESIRMRPFYEFYCAYTHRLDQSTAKLLGVPSFSKEIGTSPKFYSRVPQNSPILTASISDSNNLSANGIRAQTAASSQGLTFNSRVGIYLNRTIHLMGSQTALVAVTRSRRGLYYHGDYSQLQKLSVNNYPLQLVFGLKSGSILNHFKHVLEHFPKILSSPDQIPKIQLRGSGPVLSIFQDESDVLIDHRVPKIFRANPERPKVDDTFVPETRRVLLQHYEPTTCSDVSTSDCRFDPAFAEPVYPGCDYDVLKYELQRLEVPEDLEKSGPSGLSNQFPYINKPFNSESQYPGLIAPVHDLKHDTDLLKSSIQKRLRFRHVSSSSLNPEDQFAGELLYYSYCQAWNISPKPVPFDEELFLECILDNDYAQLTSKTRAAIISNASRSDPSWRHTIVRIFAKTQHKINLNSIFTGWKACQTLALMHDIVISLLGPVKKYQRAVLARQTTATNIFLYGGKSPYDLSSFAQANFTPNTIRIANDYTAYDQSQGPEAVHFEVLKMRRVGIPDHLIEFHQELKMNLTCQFGPLTPMRFTGEPGTYDDNSDYNLAIINLEYHLGNTPTCISGDDSLLNHEPPKRASWAQTSRFFRKLVWKKESSLYGEFCGYYVSHVGAVRAPQPLLAKLGLSKARDELGLTLASYLTEFCVGHSLGDSMWQALPSQDILYQSAVFDFFCRHAPPFLKVALKIGSVPDELLLKMNIPLNYHAFCKLSHSSRKEYLTRGKRNEHAWSL